MDFQIPKVFAKTRKMKRGRMSHGEQGRREVSAQRAREAAEKARKEELRAREEEERAREEKQRAREEEGQEKKRRRIGEIICL